MIVSRLPYFISGEPERVQFVLAVPLFRFIHQCHGQYRLLDARYVLAEVTLSGEYDTTVIRKRLIEQRELGFLLSFWGRPSLPAWVPRLEPENEME